MVSEQGRRYPNKKDSLSEQILSKLFGNRDPCDKKFAKIENDFFSVSKVTREVLFLCSPYSDGPNHVLICSMTSE